MKTMTIQCFGAFRQFGDNLVIKVNSNATPQTVREVLINTIGKQHQTLINSTRFASETTILPENVAIDEHNIIAIPPVSGG